jgi:hypothetical protein
MQIRQRIGRNIRNIRSLQPDASSGMMLQLIDEHESVREKTWTAMKKERETMPRLSITRSSDTGLFFKTVTSALLFALCIAIAYPSFLFAGVTISTKPESSQEFKDVLKVTPGEGVGELKLGMARLHVTRLLGEPLNTVDYLKEKANWENAGYDPDQEIQFFKGFDYYLEYDCVTNVTDYPAWKVYFKNDRVVYVILSSFIFEKKRPKRVGIPPDCFFGSLKHGVRKTLGDDYFEFVDSENNFNLHYLENGISVVLTEEKVGVMNIFSPFSKEEKKAFLKEFEPRPAPLAPPQPILSPEPPASEKPDRDQKQDQEQTEEQKGK